MRLKNKKQELIKQITKMLQPYEDIDAYNFTITLFQKTGEYTNDQVRISFNDTQGLFCPANGTTIV